MPRNKPPTVEDVKAALERGAADMQRVRGTRPFRPMQNKFGAKRTNGYASKREAEYADMLRSQKAAGLVADWIEQVPVRLPGATKYVADFMVIMNDGSVRFVEVKGKPTEVWKLKMRQLAELRPEIFSRLEVVK